MQDWIGKEVVFAVVGQGVLSREKESCSYYGTLEKVDGTMVFLKNITIRPDKKDEPFDAWFNTTSLFFLWVRLKEKE